MSKFYNNVKSRLNKQGYTGFVKDDYTEACNAVGVINPDNPSTEQINAGVVYLISKRSSSLAVPEGKPDSVWLDRVPDTKESTDLSIPDQGEIESVHDEVLATINSQPEALKQDLLVAYAEKQFSTVQDFLAFKEAVDSRVNAFFSSQLAKQQQQESGKWDATLQSFKTTTEKEAVKRQSHFQEYLQNLDTRISEFK
jgi:hypothetical protein